MLLEIDTANLTEGEARATIAYLVSLFPEASSAIGLFMTGVSAIEGSASIGELTVRLDASELRETLAEIDADPEAAFGQPAPLDPATAFAAAPLADAAAGAPVSPAGAPSSPIAGAPTPVPGVDLDTDGVPWDARIHAGTKNKSQKGAWKVKKGLGDGVHASVTTELKAIMAATPAGATPSTSAHALAAAVADPAAVAAPPPPPPQADAGAPPPPPPPADPHPVQDGQSPAAAFAAAMKKVTEAQKADKVTVVDLDTIIKGLGLATMRDLMHRPDLIPSFEEQLAAYVASAP